MCNMSRYIAHPCNITLMEMCIRKNMKAIGILNVCYSCAQQNAKLYDNKIMYFSTLSECIETACRCACQEDTGTFSQVVQY